MEGLLLLNIVNEMTEALVVIVFILVSFYLFFQSVVSRFHDRRLRREITFLAFGSLFAAISLLIKDLLPHVLNIDVAGNDSLKIYSSLLISLPAMMYCSYRMGYERLSGRGITLMMFAILGLNLLALFFPNRLSFFLYLSISIYGLVWAAVVIDYTIGIKRILTINPKRLRSITDNMYIFLLTSIFSLFAAISSAIGSPGWISSMSSLSVALIIVILIINIIFKKQLFESSRYLEDDEDEVTFYHNVHGECNESELRERIIRYFDQEKPYLRSKLSINEVSVELFTNKSYVSKVINDSFSVNFNQFLNKYRVEEAKRIFLDDPAIPVKILCEKSGFGSFASFSIAFRLFTGSTPADWCKNQRIKMRFGESDKN